MSQQENFDKSEKKNKREKKNKADTKYNKTDKELEILKNLLEEWNREPYRSPNKEKICMKYLNILRDNGFSYELSELKEYCNNHRNKNKIAKNPQNNTLPLNQLPQTLPDQAYSQQEILKTLQGTPNQKHFQQQAMNNLTNQSFIQPDNIQLPNQAYPQQTLQYPLNQAFLQQQNLPPKLLPVQTQHQQLPFNQSFPSQQSFQHLPNQPFTQELPQQEIIQPPPNGSYSQKAPLQPPSAQPFLNKALKSANSQQYGQTPMIQPFKSVTSCQYPQQTLQPQPNQIYSQQQPLISQTNPQKQPLAEKISLQQQAQSQNDQKIQQQEIPSYAHNSMNLLDGNQPKPGFIGKTTAKSPNNPVSPELSELQLSDSIPFSSSLFSSDISQDPSRTNSLNLDFSAQNIQTQKSSNLKLNISDQAQNENSSFTKNKEINTTKINAYNEPNSENKNVNYIPQNVRNATNGNDDNEHNADEKDDNEHNADEKDDNEHNADENNDNDETDNEDGVEDSNIEISDQKNSNEVSDNSKNERKKRVLIAAPHGGKQVGKYYYFPSDTVYTSYSSSSSSPYSVSLPGKLQSSADKKVSDDEFINQLPDIPKISGELNESNLDNFKNDLYNSIKICYKYIHEASSNYHQKSSPNGEIIFNEKLFNFQKEVEKRLNTFTKLLSEILHIYQIGSNDKNCSHIELISKKNILSTTTRIYTGENFSDSGFPSRTNSESVSDSSASQSNNNDDNSNNNVDVSNCTVTSYISNIKRLNLNEKLSSFYTGKINEETRYSIDIQDVEAFTVLSYTYKPPGNDDDEIIVCEYAYVNYYFNSHVLNIKGVKCETGFFRPVTAMYFHHFDDGTNKVYLCGDVRVKEFTITGLESGDSDQITIQNTNTFYFGSDSYQSSVITIWDKELVLAVDSRIFFWSIEDDFKLRKSKETIDTKANKNLVKQSGIDESKIDWTHGKNCKSNQITVNSTGLNRITSFCILGQQGNSFLAVASINYPVIYIYNKKLQNISRLVAHTMGVTCLKSLNYQLFSGSLDLMARLWDVNNGMPILNINTRCERIMAIDSNKYCDKIILFTGGEDHAVQCFSVTDKKPLFEIKLNDNLVPLKISFCVGHTKNGDHAKLMIISDCENRNCLTNFRKCQVHYFEFI